jgi:hypothetical protein
MRLTLVTACLVLASIGIPATQAVSLDQLGWMAGCWRQQSSGRVVDEMWMAPSGGAMLGVSRTVAKGRASAHEFMQIREDGGRIAFIARPSGQAEASFALIKNGPREVVFENPAHDFPQRVIYQLESNTLIGRIEGTQNGKSRSAEFPMRKIACP